MCFCFTGAQSWKPEVEGATDRSSLTSDRPLPRGVRSEYNSYERTKASSPGSGRESQRSSFTSSESKHRGNPAGLGGLS